MQYIPMKRTDYCAKIKAVIQEKQTSINRKLQSGNADATEIEQLEDEKKALEDKLQEHNDIARDSLEYYKEMKKKCCEQWKEIAVLESNSDRNSIEDEQLEELKHCFTLSVRTIRCRNWYHNIGATAHNQGQHITFKNFPMISSELLTTGTNHLQYTFLMKEWATKQQTIPYPIFSTT